MSAAANKALDSRLIRAVVRPIWRLAQSRHLIIVELFSAAVAIIPFGVVPILAGDTLSRAPAYHLLLVVMQFLFGSYANTGFGFLFIVFGLCQATGYIRGWHSWRVIAAFCGTYIWWGVGLLLVWSDWRTTGYTYLLLGWFMAWARLRLSLSD